MIQILLFLFSNTGIVIVDNVWYYGDDQAMRMLNTGDSVQIIKTDETDLVRINAGGLTSTVNKGVLIDLQEPYAEERLFVFALGYYDEGECEKARMLLEIFLNKFPGSEYRAEALYYCGLCHEEKIKRSMAPDSLKYTTINEKNKTPYYNGFHYEEILKSLPESIFAAKAEYRLILIFRAKSLPWYDSVSLINAELRRWQEFLKKYPTCDEYFPAQLETGFLYRALFEITGTTSYRDDAVRTYEAILQKNEKNVFSAQARINLHEITAGEKIYKY